jgi:glycosyltransferase involved in cell wall biosynthesis
MKPKVSVIIPTYNRAHYIQKALDSVMAQTYQDFEVIVIDDGSTDNTREVVKQYGEKVRYFYQENTGIPGARNAGIRNSAGDYIAFLDSDDYWVKEKLERQMALFSEHPEYGMVASCCASIEQDGSFREKNRPGKSGWILEDIFQKNFIRTSSAIVKRECLEKIGLFDEELQQCQEYDLWMHIAVYYPIGFINESLSVYVDNPHGISTESLTGRLFRLKALEKEYLRKRIPEKMYKKRIAAMCLHIGRHYVKKGENQKGETYLKRALALNPLNAKNLFYLVWGFLKH